MTKAKAEKHLRYAREDLDNLRESYVEFMRNPNWQQLKTASFFGENYFVRHFAEIRKDMSEVKERIARLERIAL